MLSLSAQKSLSVYGLQTLLTVASSRELRSMQGLFCNSSFLLGTERRMFGDLASHTPRRSIEGLLQSLSTVLAGKYPH